MLWEQIVISAAVGVLSGLLKNPALATALLPVLQTLSTDLNLLLTTLNTPTLPNPPSPANPGQP